MYLYVNELLHVFHVISPHSQVWIEVNGEPIDDLCMKLGENGEAFFVEETETEVLCRHSTISL